MAPVVVVGAGISGLALAHELDARGVDVLVLEAGTRAGGLLHTEPVDGWLCEHAATAFLPAEQGALELAGRLGVACEEASAAAKRRWVYRGGKLRVVPAGPPGLWSTDLLSWRGKLRLLAEPLVRKRGAADESVEDFFRRRLGEEAAAVLAGPLVLGIFAGDAAQLQMAAAFPRVHELEQRHGSLVRGMFAGRKQPRGKLGAPRAGTGALVDALAARLGDRLRLSARVSEIEPRRVRVGGAWIDAEAVALAVPASVAAALVAPLDLRLSELLAGVHSAPVLVAYAGLARADVPHALDGFGLLVAAGERPRALGVVFESVVWPGRAPDGQVLFRLIYGGTPDPGAVALGDVELASVVSDDLRRLLGVTRTPHFFRVVRHTVGIPQYVRGHVERVAEIDRRAAALDVTLGGNGLHGVAVNDCVRDAQRAADQLTRGS